MISLSSLHKQDAITEKKEEQKEKSKHESTKKDTDVDNQIQKVLPDT